MTSNDPPDDPSSDADPSEQPSSADGPPDAGPVDTPPRDAQPTATDGGTDRSEEAADGGVTEEDEEFTDEEAEELLKEIERKRTVSGAAAVFVAFVALTFSTFQLFLAAQGFEFGFDVPFVGEVQIASLQLLQINAIHVVFALILAFFLYPPTTGDGFVARRLAQAVPAAERRFGPDSPLSRVARRSRGVARWLAVDPKQERVTPLDVLFSFVAFLTAAYFITDFAEIQNVVRIRGLSATRTVAEYYAGAVESLLGPGAGDLVGTLLGALPLGDAPYAFLLGVLGVLLVLEATRRSLGLPLMIIVASFIIYARWGYFISPEMPLIGNLSILELRWGSIVQNLWYNTENGVFGIPVTVSVQFIYIFILFGAFLEMSGAGQWFIDLAYAATGTRKGGPAKASILASGFMGTISGSSIANTVTTGAFTIPLMKRSGYDPEFSGAVEASASSGGQILPPVMGAAAFLIVQYTQTPFADVIVAAAIPAFIFFFGVWVMVHLEASRANIGGLSRDDVVDLRPHVNRGWFYLVPLVLLLYYLIVERLSVARSAWFTVVAVVALITLVAAYNDRTRLPLAATFAVIAGAEFASFLVGGVGVIGLLSGAGGAGVSVNAAFAAILGKVGWYAMAAGVVTLAWNPRMTASLLRLDPQVQDAADEVAEAANRPSLSKNRLFRLVTFGGKSMESGARTAVPVVVAVAAAGIIPGVISVSGLGPNLVSLILDISAGSLVLMLLVTAVASIILGMGMPTTVTYIILVSLLGPALVEFGIPILAAHLFILYFGVVADITPPVAVAAYAASGVAKSDAFQTGVDAFSLSLNKAIVPFAFILTPGIILLRTGVEVPGSDKTYRVVNFGDLFDPAFAFPEIVVPVFGVVVGVVALGGTVIGYLYAPLNRLERTGFAVSSLLLMAPGLLYIGASDVASLLGSDVQFGGVFVELALRLLGLAIFVLLTVRNRRQVGSRPASTGSVESETA
jgi:TRAP transporter 4TM/12TM fusion protein